MISFTNDLSAANRKAGLWLLGYYYRDSVISKAPYYPITNFDGSVKFLDKNYPTYIEYLGSLLKTIDQDKMITAMKNAAARKLTDYPRPAYFNNELIKLTSFSPIDASLTAVSETASDIGSGLVMGSRIILGLMVVGGLIVGYLYLKPFLPKGK